MPTTLAERVERAFVFREYLDRAWSFFHSKGLPLDWNEKSTEVLALLDASIQTRIVFSKRCSSVAAFGPGTCGFRVCLTISKFILEGTVYRK